MKAILALLALWLLVAAAPPVLNGPVQVCRGPEHRSCTPIDLVNLRLTGAETHVERVVTVPPESLPLSRPLMVSIIAMASSEVRWNGVLIGRNGRPGPDRASERPGRFIASVMVPPELVRPGPNVLSLRLSAHHLWLPVRRTVHAFFAMPYETQSLPGLADYLPAMLTAGALLAALIYFAAEAFSDRRGRGAGLIALIAGTAMIQMAIEVARAFIAYSYPWHLVRVAAIALLAGATAILAVLYTVRRFAPAWEKRVLAWVSAAVLASLILIPWYDVKAMAAILAGALAIGACALHGLREQRTSAAVALAGSLLIVGMLAWQLTFFLDQAYYLIVAALLLTLVGEQVAILRAARRNRDSEAERAAALEERLRQATETGETIVQLKDGSRLHRVPEADILYVRAADDYCDVVLGDGRTLLVTMSLSRLLATLSDRFLRVHKSYAVNRSHVTAVAARPGGGRQLVLARGSSVPVGRSFTDTVAQLRGS